MTGRPPTPAAGTPPDAGTRTPSPPIPVRLRRRPPSASPCDPRSGSRPRRGRDASVAIRPKHPRQWSPRSRRASIVCRLCVPRRCRARHRSIHAGTPAAPRHPRPTGRRTAAPRADCGPRRQAATRSRSWTRLQRRHGVPGPAEPPTTLGPVEPERILASTVLGRRRLIVGEQHLPRIDLGARE